MSCLFRKFVLSVAVIVASVLALGISCFSMTISYPTADQVVHGKVKILLPASVLPAAFFTEGVEKPFIGIFVGKSGKEDFMQALSSGAVVKEGDKVAFIWNTKAAYHDASDAKTDKYFKDGSYSLRIDIYQQTALTNTKVLESGSVNIILKNKLDRTEPALGVSLVNKLAFGQSNTYKYHTVRPDPLAK